jgi:hypothetical protein
MATYYIDPSVPGPGNGTLASPFSVYGSRTVISNNVFMGTTRSGIYQDSTSSDIVKFNNMYLGVPYPVVSPIFENFD